MSYLQVTAIWPQNQYNKLRGSAIHSIPPVNIFNYHNALKPAFVSSKQCTKLIKCQVIKTSGVSRYQQCTPLCLSVGKGESKSDNQASPWKAMEKAMSNLKKEQSLEDLLRQQMEKQEYFEGGSGGGGGGSDGGGGGFGGGGTEDEGFAEILDDILQATLAIIGLIVLYLYIIAGDQVTLFLSDTFAFLLGKRGPRLRTIMYGFARFHQMFRAKVPYDPYWLEKAIITTPTFYDSPNKYRRMLNISTRPTKSSRNLINSDSDDKAYDDDDDDAYNRNTYDKNNDNDDDDDDYNAYGEDVDDEI